MPSPLGSNRHGAQAELGPDACAAAADDDDTAASARGDGPRGSGLGAPRTGDFVIYGKPASRGACAREGVAQLINDHSSILPPAKRAAYLASLGGKRAAAKARARGLFRGGGMGSDTRLDGADAALASVSQAGPLAGPPLRFVSLLLLLLLLL